MNPEEIDPENLDDFQLPEGILSQLFEFTGCNDGDSGFILSYVSQHGQPEILTKTSSPIVEMGLRKALEQYLRQVSCNELKIEDIDEEDNP